ncbi:EAL domain-containing protein [Aromatoleum petrolei]|uniref:EAL domain-containing protein n=1 Tax=Aromatoleum petrolei TaxID=76116 RepID=A0ABX1MMH7_9RHOO|nr:EAL domain-containing protein [Aromatoleum petrolei]NMF89147.1 EAL domain-containing protein [Aromatoleum petrolei]QTQ36535.1 Diguanylate cyclase/phosphodiesterase, PAS domain-containing [Aromatoleum petrolei]
MAKLLIVDDYEPTRDLFSTLLSYDGHAVLEAVDGAEALQIVAAEHPDLVICDILMPTMDGYEFVRRLRDAPELAATRVMFHTANYHEREAHHLAEGLGVSRIVIKPCQPEDFLAAVHEALAADDHAPTVAIAKDFDKDHRQLLTNKLAAKAEELEQANQRLAALTELNLKLSAERDTRLLLDKVCQGVRELTGASYALVALQGNGDGRGMVLLGHGLTEEQETGFRNAIQGESGVLAEMMAERRPMRFSNPGGRPELLGLPPQFPAVHCGVAAPVASAMAVYGWVCLFNKLGAPEFSEEDEWISGAHAAHAGRVYENWILYRRLEQRADELAVEIANRKAAELQLRRVLRARKVMAECNRTLVRASDEIGLLGDMCRFLVGHGGFGAAWVGLVRHDAECSIETVASAGDDHGALQSMHFSWSDTEAGQTPLGKAVRSGEAQIVRDMSHDPATERWREGVVLRRPIEAAGAFPLICRGEPLGVLCILAAESDAFDTDEVNLLKELADDIAYGLRALRSLAAQRQMEDKLRLRNRAIEESINAIVISEARSERDNPIIYVNPAFTLMTGYPAEDVIGRNPRILLGGDWAQPDIQRLRDAVRSGGSARVTLRNYRRDGSLFWNDVSVASMRDARGRVTHFISVFNDLTDRKRYELELEKQANHDALTGLANRNLLQDRLERGILRANRGGKQLAVMLLDLDRFKFINDSLGHPAGDRLLCEVAGRLRARLREEDTVARLGGDEFMIVLPDVGSESNVASLAAKCLDTLTAPVRLSGHDVRVTASIGIALYPRDAEEPESLLKNADVAMYRAKQGGRNGFRFYAPEMNARAMERLALEGSLRGALERGEFELHYQPKVSLADGMVFGAEALLRWRDPQAGLVSPANFIPLAEETGLIVPIGEWVIDSACRQLAAWRAADLSGVSVAVNVSPRQFQQSDLLALLQNALRRWNVPAHQLHVEVTESAMMEDPERAIAVLASLRDAGIQIALDDFGTGYSSLNYFKRFPLDCIKIDQSFVAGIPTSREDAEIALMIISLAHSLGRQVVAEGVETEEQLSFLRQHGCDAIQGYLFSRPVMAADFPEYLARRLKP